jgi:hypothetical protein
MGVECRNRLAEEVSPFPSPGLGRVGGVHSCEESVREGQVVEESHQGHREGIWPSFGHRPDSGPQGYAKRIFHMAVCRLHSTLEAV